MNTIKFNNNEYEVLTFNKNTYFNNNTITSNASCQIKTADITSLHTLAAGEIETLQIYHDEDLIYDLQNVHGKLGSIDEYLMDDRVNINLNINFNYSEEEETSE